MASQNDAGSGQDAGDTPAQAILVPNAARVFTANLTPPGTDADWYRHALTGAFCTVAQATPTSAGLATLASDASGGAAVSRNLEPHRVLTVALAAPAGRAPHFGVQPASFMSALETRDSTPDPGRYTFGLRSFGLADLDPEGDGEGTDAANGPGAARALSGPCHAGRLGQGDQDWYALDVASPRELTISLAVAGSGDPVAALVAPDGSVRLSVSSGGAATAWAGETGRWHVVVSHAPRAAPAPGGLALALPLASTGAALVETADYILGTTDGPGDTNPCRPSCR